MSFYFQQPEPELALARTGGAYLSYFSTDEIDGGGSKIAALVASGALFEFYLMGKFCDERKLFI